MKCDELKYEKLGDMMPFYPPSTLVIRKQFVDEAIAELKAKLESVQASAYAESVDAGMENRRLKRALWMARGYIMTLLSSDFQRLAYQNNDDYKKTCYVVGIDITNYPKSVVFG